jgi:uncharacterized membrane protein
MSKTSRWIGFGVCGITSWLVLLELFPFLDSTAPDAQPKYSMASFVVVMALLFFWAWVFRVNWPNIGKKS